MSSKKKLLNELILHLAEYLESYLPLANFHMVDYFTSQAYEHLISNKIKEDIQSVGFEEVINCIFKDDYKKLPQLNLYNRKSKEFTLKNLEVCLKAQDLQKKLSSLGCCEPLRLKLNVFMTSKKSHEVDILSYTAAALRNISETTHLIDIGDGKGYLSSILALHHKIPVLGVDASEMNTNGAMVRVKKLSRVWKSVVASNGNLKKAIKNELSPETVKLNDKTTTVNLYKQVTKYVDTNVDFSELVSNIFLEKPDGLGLVGLHTCGNLATTSLRIFSTNRNIKTICNVSCCYHLISERFEKGEWSNKNKDDVFGFPMSKLLNDTRFVIGRAGRMIAAQSMDRILDKRELPNETIFYRALFEIILEKEFKELDHKRKHVGRMRKKCDNFLDYTRKAFKKLNLNTNITDSEIEDLYEEYKHREYELYVFYLIRNMLSPIIETLILLDRLLYLQELGIDHSYLVQFFDPVVSPRCYGLVAIK